LSIEGSYRLKVVMAQFQDSIQSQASSLNYLPNQKKEKNNADHGQTTDQN